MNALLQQIADHAADDLKKMIEEGNEDILKAIHFRRVEEKHNDIFDEAQAANYLQVSTRCCRLWRHKRGLPHYRLTAKVIRFRRADLDEWLNKFYTQSTPARTAPTRRKRTDPAVPPATDRPQCKEGK